ncbi:hypothetical protein P167DRAFT_543366 [Morchella conica CCBAS932]|uniref:Uncharacterized protein n=1 Tax=Morchella conica CCBAS932 TaxID=1392247 RepID=A0A3N4KWY0_9PEZI|nr:hypothetical protein P167DRAFT_543366 [Morchella conica CCBAS932]
MYLVGKGYFKVGKDAGKIVDSKGVGKDAGKIVDNIFRSPVPLHWHIPSIGSAYTYCVYSGKIVARPSDDLIPTAVLVVSSKSKLDNRNDSGSIPPHSFVLHRGRSVLRYDAFTNLFTDAFTDAFTDVFTDSFTDAFQPTGMIQKSGTVCISIFLI